MKLIIKILIILLGFVGASNLHPTAHPQSSDFRHESKEKAETPAMEPFSYEDVRKHGPQIYEALNGYFKGNTNITHIVDGFTSQSVSKPAICTFRDKVLGYAMNPLTNDFYAIQNKEGARHAQVYKYNLLTGEEELCRNFPRNPKKIFMANNRLIIIDEGNSLFSFNPSSPSQYKKNDELRRIVTGHLSNSSFSISPEGNHFILFPFGCYNFYIFDIRNIERPSKHYTLPDDHTGRQMRNSGVNWIDENHFRVLTPIASHSYRLNRPEPLAEKDCPVRAPYNADTCMILELHRNTGSPESGPALTLLSNPPTKHSHASRPLNCWQIIDSHPTLFNSYAYSRIYVRSIGKSVVKANQRSLEMREHPTSEPFEIPIPLSSPTPTQQRTYVAAWTPINRGALVYTHDDNLSQISWRSPFSMAYAYGKSKEQEKLRKAEILKIEAPKKAALKKKLLFGSAFALASYVGLKILTSPKAR